MRNKLFLYWEKSLEKPGIQYSILRFIFFLLSLGFRASVYLWELLYLSYSLPQKKEDCFIVSIGNITAGGTGKTPILINIGKELINKEIPVAILSRGYRSLQEHKPPILACAKKGPLYNWEVIGDEPYIIAKNLPESFLYVGKDRLMSATAAREKATVLLLDDGMQYKKLQKDLQIVCINANDPLGKGYFLPRGYLREHPKALQKANFITIQPLFSEKEFHMVQKILRHWTLAPMIGFKSVIEGFYGLDGTKKQLSISTPIALFCGIADPFRAYTLLTKNGYTIALKTFLSDHQEFSGKHLTQFISEAKAKEAVVVCTEKDAVKLPGTLLPSIVYLKHSLQPVYGQEHWKMLIEKIIENSK